MADPEVKGNKFISSIKKLLITLKLMPTDKAATPQQPHDHQAREKLRKLVDRIDFMCKSLHLSNSEDEPRPPESAWVINVKEKLQQARQDNKACLRAEHSIYRIPHNLKDGEDNKAYIPHIVSLGPYHHYDEGLRQMDQHKWRCLASILRRTNTKIGLYLDSVKEVEKRACAFYEGTISMSSDDFAQMMVLDGCFVIELMLGFIMKFANLGYPPNDPVFSRRGLMYTIKRDMIMLENQIPLFILDRLLGVQLGEPHQTGLVAMLARLFFKSLKPAHGQPVNLALGTIQGKSHCLGVFWESLVPQVPEPVQSKHHQVIHCVTELRKAGIKFKKGETNMFWDIKFKDGILQIPPLMVDEGTRLIFLNLIAFEQCHVNCGKTITSYVFFMDNLINSSEDVGHLFDHGIIKHCLGSDVEVAELFNLLGKGVLIDIDHNYLSKLSEEVNDYFSYKWNGWVASLQFKYFSNPWSIISLIAAFFLLVLTFIQTFYGVYGYYKPGS